MRIHVVADDTISTQARTYAEYRVFAALAQLTAAEQMREARVCIRRVKRSHAGNDVTCSVTVAFVDSNPVRVRGMGDHPYAAINRAVERLRSASEPASIRWGSVASGR